MRPLDRNTSSDSGTRKVRHLCRDQVIPEFVSTFGRATLLPCPFILTVVQEYEGSGRTDHVDDLYPDPNLDCFPSDTYRDFETLPPRLVSVLGKPLKVLRLQMVDDRFGRRSVFDWFVVPKSLLVDVNRRLMLSRLPPYVELSKPLTFGALWESRGQGSRVVSREGS